MEMFSPENPHMIERAMIFTQLVARKNRAEKSQTLYVRSQIIYGLP